jgi:aromatic ring-opening dioxygenase catalytic subunit (LigB family)
MGDFLLGLAATLEKRPTSILLVSAHWQGPAFTVTSAAAPALYHDYYGFPPHTYDLKYPAPGNPALAGRVRDLLDDSGIANADDPARGFDHGMFIPLKLVFPDADIPVVQLSLRSDYSPAAHLAAGAALAPLRDEGVLIIGSGMSFHNMAALRNPASVGNRAVLFDSWLTDAVTQSDPAAARALLKNWDRGTEARFAHPPRAEEHLLPLMVAAGAAGDDRGRCLFTDPLMAVSGYRFG